LYIIVKDVFGHLAAFLSSYFLIGHIRKHRSVLNCGHSGLTSPPHIRTGLIYSLVET